VMAAAFAEDILLRIAHVETLSCGCPLCALAGRV
jgi:hypothetical protein